MNKFNPSDYVRHVATNNIYKVLDLCTYEPTGIKCYAYMGNDARLWVRPVTEMEDGRFVFEFRDV